MKDVKVLVVGPYGSGKTTFVKTLCPDAVTTESRVTRKEPGGKETTTVALDYGTIRIGDTRVHLFGTPGQERFRFMLDILSKNVDAFILLLDLATPREEARKLEELAKKAGKPVIVAVNTKGKERGFSAANRELAMAVLIEALEKIRKYNKRE